MLKYELSNGGQSCLPLNTMGTETKIKWMRQSVNDAWANLGKDDSEVHCTDLWVWISFRNKKVKGKSRETETQTKQPLPGYTPISFSSFCSEFSVPPLKLRGQNQPLSGRQNGGVSVFQMSSRKSCTWQGTWWVPTMCQNPIELQHPLPMDLTKPCPSTSMELSLGLGSFVDAC